MAEGVDSCGGLWKKKECLIWACRQLLLLLLLWEGTNLVFCSAGYDEQLCHSARICQLLVGTLLGGWSQNAGETSLAKASFHLSANVFPCPWVLPPLWAVRGRGWVSTVPYLQEMWALLGLETEVILLCAWTENTWGMLVVFSKSVGENRRSKSQVISTRCWLWTLRKAIFALLPWCLFSRLKHLGGGEDTILIMFWLRWVDCKENSCC